MTEHHKRRDWVAWHEDYRDPGAPLARRLAEVQRQIRAAVGQAPAPGYRIVALCAGQGDDLLGALAGDRIAASIRARLVESDPHNVAVLRDRIAAAGLTWEAVEADAADLGVYAGAIPADLVLACGVFGNVSDADVMRTVAALPAACRPGATVIWTRHRRAPDLTPRVREAFAAAGFAERAFVAPAEEQWSVGVHRLTGAPLVAPPGGRLFTFVV